MHFDWFESLEYVNAGLRIPRGVGRHPSRILNVFELVYVRSGELYLVEEDRHFAVGPGQALLLHPGKLHAAVGNYGESLIFYWAYFRADQSLLQVPQFVRLAKPERMLELWHRLLEDRDIEVPGNPAITLSLARILVELIVPNMGRDSTSAPALLARRASAYIQSHLEEELSTSQLADRLGCCPDYLGRVFRRVYGHTVSEAIQIRRVDHARTLLLVADMSIDEVARECGFIDTGYFRRIFRRHTGMTPAAYQRQHLKIHLLANLT